MNIYSFIPQRLKGPVVEATFIFFETAFLYMTIITLSSLTTFSSVLAFCMQQILNGLSALVEIGEFSEYSIRSILFDFKKLQFSLRRLNTSLSTALLVTNIVTGLQQTFQVYTVLQMIHQGLPGEMVMPLLLDIFVSWLNQNEYKCLLLEQNNNK
jgi:hypothetical protein